MAGPDLVSRWFGDVDRAPDPTKMVRYLDNVTGLRDIQALKRATYEFVGAGPGSVLLDVGCGAGDDVRALARLVGSAGRVVGLDFSRSVVTEAQARSVGLEFRTEFCRGNACHLPFPDGHFDGARSERMLQHLPRPEDAVREMARVVRKGGRVVALDPDWDTMAIDSTDRPLTRRIITFHTEGVTSGWVGRHLLALFRDAGLEEVAVQASAISLTDFAAASPILEIEATVERALGAGALAADEAAAWLAEMRERDAAGRFFCAITAFLACGRKA